MPGEWIEQLPGDLKTNPALDPYRDKNLGDFAKDTLGKLGEYEGKVREHEGKVTEYSKKVTDLEGKLTNSIPKLGDKATDEERAAFRKALGVPDKPEDYKFPNPEGGQNSPELVKWFSSVAHARNLNQEQAAGMVQDYNTMVSAVVKAEQANIEKAKSDAETALKKEAGSEDQYKANIALADRLWKKVMGSDEGFTDMVKSSGFVSNPFPILKFIITVGKKVGEDFTPQGSPPKSGDKTEIVYDKSPPPPTPPR